MKTFEAIYLPAATINPTKGGFKTEDEAWDYASEHFCDECKKMYDRGEGSSCDAEWMVDIEEQ